MKTTFVAQKGSKTRRQTLLEFCESGKLRDSVQAFHLNSDAADLLVDIVFRYCEPRKKGSQ